MSEATARSATEEAPDVEIKFPHANIVAISAIAGTLATTVGPISNDKLLINQLATRHQVDHPSQPPMDEFTVSGDGATILESLPLEHPITPVVMRLIGPERPGDTDVEGAFIPDGIATTLLLTAALLEEAESLLELGISPIDIQRGYETGLEVALDTMSVESRELDSFDNSDFIEQSVARTALTGNDVANYGETWADLAVEAARRIGMPNEKTLAVRQISAGSIQDSRLVPGAVLDRNKVCFDEMPTSVPDANILLLSGFSRGGGLQDPDSPEDTTLQLQSMNDIDEIEDVYGARRTQVLDRLLDMDVNVVIARQGISDEYQRLLAANGIMGVRRVNHIDLKQVALATGANLVQDPLDVEPADLGTAGIVKEVMREPRRYRRRNRWMVVIDECVNPESVCILLRGVTGQLSDQATTGVRKATAAVASAYGLAGCRPGVVPGGGALEVEIAMRARDTANQLDSRQQLAVASFATAIERVLTTLIRNAGVNPLDILPDLRAAHTNGRTTDGFVLPEKSVRDTISAGVLDPVSIRRRAFVSATEVSTRVLRIDDAIDVIHVEEPAGPGEAINDEEAEKHMEYLEEHDDTRWD